MPKSKEKTGSLGHKRSKGSKKDPKASAHRSQEFVGDSDSEDNKSALQVSRKEKKSQSTSKDNLEKSQASKSKSSLPAVKKEESSDDDSDDSESSSETSEEEVIPKKPVKKAENINGVKRKAEEQSSSEEDSEESEVDSGAPVAKRTKAQDTSSSEEAESEDGEKETATISAPETNGPKSTASQSYKPPTGYSKLDATTLNSSTDLKSSSLSGKQIWHISAPSNISLESITQLSLNAFQNATQSGAPVLSHKGVDYIFAENPSSDASTAVLVPGNDGYTTAKQNITKSLRLQQQIDLPNLTIRQANQNTGSAAAADVATAAVSTVRPQPKGLRMRFKPLGFGEGKPGQIGSDTESDDGRGAASSFQFPKALGGHGASEHAPAAKKSKKKHKEKYAEERDTEMANGVTPEKLSKEEKAKRKEERRLKKEKK